MSGEPQYPQHQLYPQPPQQDRHGGLVLISAVVGAAAGVLALVVTLVIWYASLTPATVDRPLAEKFLPRYWHLVTTHPAKAYALLDDSFRTGSLHAYARYFHNRYDRIDVSHISLPQNGYFAATITYYSPNGAISPAREHFRLVCPDSSKYFWNSCEANDVQIDDTADPWH